MISNKKVKGSIRPRPSKDNVKYYDITLELGTDKITGERKRLYFKVNTTDRQEALNHLLTKQAEYVNDALIEPSKKTVALFMDEYMEDYVTVHNAPASIKDYSSAIEKYIKPAFGHIRLQELDVVDIQRTYNQWKRKSPLSDKPLKESTIKHINRVFKAGLGVAKTLGYIDENPAKKVKISKDINTEHIDVYTSEEIKKLQLAVKNTDMELPVALLFDCVMRRGELLGLCFSDIDWETNTVTIQKSWTEGANGNPVLKDCKTDSSYRKIVVTDYTMKLLRKQKLLYMKNRMKYGDEFCNSDRVVCKENGEPFLPKSFTHKWAKTLKRHGLRHIKLHGTRHSAITLLLSEGLALNLVQARAGHKDPKVTLAVYSHVANDKQGVVAEALQSLIFSAVNE
jgi:integrase